jgi:hypothetical protein
MPPTNQQLFDFVNILGKFTIDVHEHVILQAELNGIVNGLIVSNDLSLSDADKQALRDALSRSESALEHIQAASQTFRKNFQTFQGQQ